MAARSAAEALGVYRDTGESATIGKVVTRRATPEEVATCRKPSATG